MTCARCEVLEEEVAYLKGELGQATDLTLLATMRVHHGIRPQAARVVERLYRARPRVLSKLQISESIKGEADSPKLIDVFVSHARKALGYDAVITHWGVGYSIGPAGIAAVEGARLQQSEAA